MLKLTPETCGQNPAGLAPSSAPTDRQRQQQKRRFEALFNVHVADNERLYRKRMMTSVTMLVFLVRFHRFYPLHTHTHRTHFLNNLVCNGDQHRARTNANGECMLLGLNAPALLQTKESALHLEVGRRIPLYNEEATLHSFPLLLRLSHRQENRSPSLSQKLARRSHENRFKSRRYTHSRGAPCAIGCMIAHRHTTNYVFSQQQNLRVSENFASNHLHNLRYFRRIAKHVSGLW